MHRMTPLQTGFRGHAGGGKKVTVDEANDGETMQSMKGTAMHGESRKDIESPQNYGFTSVVAKADKDKDGNITGSAEGILSAMGGSSSHAVVAVMDDRRHRLKDLKPGDSGMYRGKDDRQQFHLAGDGTYMTARNDRKQRFALVDPPQDDKQQQAPSGPTATQTAASSGGGGSGGTSGGKDDKKPKGQKPAMDDNKKSSIALEQNGKETFSQHGQYYSSVRGGSDASNYYQSRKKSSQATDKHVHMRFEDNRIWVDQDGHWSEQPILQKKDKHCKE